MNTNSIKVGDRHISYRITGSGNTTVVMLHGGPGLGMDSLEIIHEHLAGIQVRVLSYNQSGSGDGNPYYKSIQQYALELNELLSALQLKNVILLGHSFGTAIVQEYLCLYPKAPVVGIVLVNGFSSGKDMVEAIHKRVATLPDEFHLKRKQLLTDGDGDGYDALLFQYWLPQFVCRLNPLPPAVVKGLLTNREAAVSYYFVGKDVLSVDGIILHWNRKNNLKDIKVPTLLISGPYDYQDNEAFLKMAEQIPGAVTSFLDNTSHFPMYESPEEFNRALVEFVKRVM